uniref:Uncharacterized protein n=1 Tax=viral metagenome TaxID=1070528 RepID=A0A6C0K8N9_9ZZZZ
MEKVRSFNTLYGELIDILVRQFPHITKLQEFGGIYRLLVKANPRGPMQYFIKNVSKYAENIFNEDVDFFLGNAKINSNVSKLVTDSGLNELWGNLDKESQKNIWRYLQGLIKLGYSSYGIRGKERIVEHQRHIQESNTPVLQYLESVYGAN